MFGTLETHILIEKQKKDRCDYGMVSHSLTHINSLTALAIDQCFNGRFVRWLWTQLVLEKT